MADDIVTRQAQIPDEWDEVQLPPLRDQALQHDHKGYSEEMCVRCGWVMGHMPLNCQNDNTPHVFPSQGEAATEIERLQAENARLASFLHPVGMTVRYDGIKDMPPERVEKILKEIRDFRCG